MDSFVRFFEISHTSLICAITTQETIKSLDSYLLFESNTLSGVEETESPMIYHITPKSNQNNLPIIFFSAFSDLISLQILLFLKNAFSHPDFSGSHCCILLFLPVSDNPKINGEILNKAIAIESETQISEILNMEYQESTKLIEKKRVEIPNFKRISDLYNKMQSYPTNQRKIHLKQFPEFKKMAEPVLSLQYQYLNCLFGQPSAGIFAPIETIPTIISGNTVYNGIPRTLTLERFLNKLLR